MSKSYILLITLSSFLMASQAQTVLPLYPGATPGGKISPDKESTAEWNGLRILQGISRPQLLVYLPQRTEKPTAAVIICPGGGYGVNAIDHEGIDVARWFNTLGIAAFVLKYRLPDDAVMTNRSTGPLQDVQQAFRLVRSRASEFHINPGHIGVMGFSAGGHLASTAATWYQKPVIPEPGNLRPDFQILIYPVISMVEGVGHMGSRENLLGKNPPMHLVEEFSSHMHVSDHTPPAFLVHASDDDAVLPENSIRYYQALVRNKVPAELHLYERGGHGFGMNNPTTKDQWTERLHNWLIGRGLLLK